MTGEPVRPERAGRVRGWWGSTATTVHTAVKPYTDRLAEWLPRPLDRVRFIKLKLAILMVGSGAVAFGFFAVRVGWLPPRTAMAATFIALVTSQFLAHGMTRPLREMTAAAKRMAQGDYSHRVRATSRDEVGQLAEAFNQMAADLGAADQQRREFIANVSHELRTPITALGAVLENLVDGVSEPDPATLRTALAQTERLSALVSELLALSSIEAGAVRLEREHMTLEPLLKEVVAEAEVMAAAIDRPVRFTIDLPDPALIVHADRARLHQVLLNLLDNATRHGPAHGEVRIAACTLRSEVVIDVQDEGPGIPPADRARIFERFTRGGRQTSGGTGLGLAIARWIIELHGGTVAVADPGSRIRITLPI
ncbi:HAMP domain-containing sensor histidine kinase [Nocardia huaxiensis]|uniref:Signal transduction histidine-protein kinase/phosphatase MprB n=1 Tax=Nocardia huaxiensis TaxID=2755382 RepID=A0A7D6VDY7_9NOCA|nr:ATP-binding protein [Nocardia huaxiensis]QLY27956.1 HAMP domain-containing protein [Nocardia huaxiensis]UFS98631.1 ATP-binding protein [Nocardia huaxiensis]